MLSSIANVRMRSVKKGKFSLLFLLFCTPFLAWGQRSGVLQASIDDIVTMSRHNTPGEQQARNRFLSEYWTYRQFLANRKPRVSFESVPVSYSRSYIKRYNSALNIDEYRPSTTWNSSVGINLEQNIDFLGGTFSLSSDLSYMKNIGDPGYKQYNAVPVAIRYSQNLLGYNEFKWEKKLAPLRYKEADKTFVKTLEENTYKVLAAYFDVAMAKEEYAMAIENVSNSDTLYRLGEKRFAIASISKSDLLALKLDKLNAGNSLLHARTALKKSYSSLINLLGLPEDTEIDPMLPTSVPELRISREQAIESARKNNPELLQATNNLIQREQSVTKASLERWFSVDLSAGIGFNQVSEAFAGVYKHPLRQDMVSISLSIPLIDWGMKRGRYNMAKSNYRVALSDMRLKETDLFRDIAITIDEIEMETDLFKAAEEAMQLAKESYTYARERFVLGKGSLNDMLLARSRNAEARKNAILSMKNFWLSYYKLRMLTLYDFIDGLDLAAPISEE